MFTVQLSVLIICMHMSGLQEESPPLEPLTLKGTEVERNDSYEFFGLHIKLYL